MKIKFEDNSYIELLRTNNNSILISIQAKDYENPLKKITNTVEISIKEFKDLITNTGVINEFIEE